MMRWPRLLAALAAFSASGPIVHAQSATCQAVDNTVRTCDNRFTCAQSFTGGALFERFTFEVVESSSPMAPLSIIIETSPDEFVTMVDTVAVQGIRLAWTVRSEAEGQSFLRVDNREGSAPIRIRYGCDQAATELTEPADEGDTVLEVDSNGPFAVGDPVLINPGEANEEMAVVAGFGSLVLERPLQFDHDAGEPVISLGPSVVAGEAESESGGLALLVAPNPSRNAATVRLAVPVSGEVRTALYDALGREVTVLHDGPLPAGPRDLALPDLAPGVYVVRAVSRDRSASAAVTVVR